MLGIEAQPTGVDTYRCTCCMSLGGGVGRESVCVFMSNVKRDRDRDRDRDIDTYRHIQTHLLELKSKATLFNAKI